MPEVPSTLHFRHRSRGVRRRALGEFLEQLAARVAAGRGVVCLITTDAELRRLNRRFLGQDRATDVLSFPSREPGGPLGEIAISFDRAVGQARELGHAVEQELRILMLHGMLHLAGMDHERDRGQMARAETRWRKQLGLPTGLIERSRRQERA